MKNIGLNEIRKQFLDFFEEKNHYVRSSYSLIPEKDKSLLLISAGMAPLKPYFMGIETPPNNRMATCQKCLRTGDIENVGKTDRHGTFFEMLGNFSFGDYFKDEAIAWSWEFSTKHLNMPEEKLWVTVYEEDDEAFEIWNKKVGIPKNKIVRLGKEDNFWEIGIGPCGPCSELYFDRGEEFGCDNLECKPGCDCDRYVEYWNLVFTQFNKDEEGNYNPLPKPNIDTGMGLERVACIMQNVDSIFNIDTMKIILDRVLKLSGKEYKKIRKDDISIRIITDHVRAVVFMVGDGILPSNEGRGYVLRRLLRRAARHGKLLGIKNNFLFKLVENVVEIFGEAYPELTDREEYIKKVISIEEDRFQQTIDQGIDILDEQIQEMKNNNKKILSGKEAFKLYDTYGFPLDLTKEILEDYSMEVDEKAFDLEMEKQRTRARSAREEMNDVGWEANELSKIADKISSDFVGYECFESDSQVLGILENGKIENEATKGKEINVVLDKTPFYPAGGGQVGDIGFVHGEGFKVQVNDCKKGINDIIIHVGTVVEGVMKTGDKAKAVIEVENRMNSARNHTATHLLHRALKDTLGAHVEQAGSLVSPERFRFDFTHFEALTQDEIINVESMVNKRVFDSLDVKATETTLKKARELGAAAQFGEKYGEVVRMISVGDYSKELCGGTHIKNSSEIGIFKIISETGVAAGVRRIEGITGRKVYEYLNEMDERLKNISNMLKSNVRDIELKIQSINEENKDIQKENEILKSKLATGSMDEILNSIEDVAGVNVITYKISNFDMNSLRSFGDKLKDKLSSGLIVLASDKDGKANFIAMATDDVIKKGVHAGKVIKEVSSIAGGGGGGRPNMAQAGAKNPEKIDEALSIVKDLVRKSII